MKDKCQLASTSLYNLRCLAFGLSICLAIIPCATIAADYSSFADFADEEIDDEIDSQVDEQIETNIDDRMEDDVDSEIEADVESSVEAELDSELEFDVDEDITIIDNGDDGIDDELDDGNEVNLEVDDQESFAAPAIDEQEKQQIERNDTKIEAAFHQLIEDEQGALHFEGQLLTVGDQSTIDKIIAIGATIKHTTRLKGFNKFLIEIEDDKSVPLKNNKDFIESLPDIILEYNHIYREQGGATLERNSTTTYERSIQNTLTKAIRSIPLKHRLNVGIIDSAIDTSHPALATAHLTTASFVSTNHPIPNLHGTAIASLLGGSSAHMKPLLSDANFYCASVFFSLPNRGNHASIKSLLLAFNWMLENNVSVVNMSLSGPANPLLEMALRELKQKGILLLAAAGNNGPTAPPAYPAAYASVIAVTAINNNNFPYFNANRGDYISIAAPGVNIFHASPNHSYGYSSGTSYAVPFATAYLALLKAIYPNDDMEMLMQKNTIDLGQAGKDNVFGYGLINPKKHLPASSDNKFTSM